MHSTILYNNAKNCQDSQSRFEGKAKKVKKHLFMTLPNNPGLIFFQKKHPAQPMHPTLGRSLQAVLERRPKNTTWTDRRNDIWTGLNLQDKLPNSSRWVQKWINVMLRISSRALTNFLSSRVGAYSRVGTYSRVSAYFKSRFSQKSTFSETLFILDDILYLKR